MTSLSDPKEPDPPVAISDPGKTCGAAGLLVSVGMSLIA